MLRYSFIALLAVLSAGRCAAHDTWLQANTNVVRTGDVVHLDLLLGNHGNDHRDFKLAGKADPSEAPFEIVSPSGKRLDLKERLRDTGYTPQEGYWTTRFVPDEPGCYLVAHQSDKVMTYGPVRSVKGAKTCFVASPTLDKIAPKNPGFDRRLGHALELVPVANPVTPMGPGLPLRVQLLYKGKPLSGARVAFIPRGETLAEGEDSQYERTTDAQGETGFTPTFGNYYLIAAHHEEPAESGPGYERTKYSATLCVYVPQLCPCCTE
jgi:uncharacterized GH25 family protein